MSSSASSPSTTSSNSSSNSSAAYKEKLQKQYENISQRMEKVNSELFALTYGSIVTQLLKDFEQVDAVNAQLEKMGFNIGSRLIDDFLAKSGVGPCADFRETAEVIAKVALKVYLGVSADVTGFEYSPMRANTHENKSLHPQQPQQGECRACTIILNDNPLTDFVELPPSLSNLCYSNLICGVIRGALEQLRMKVVCYFTQEVLKGDKNYAIRLELKELMKDEFVDDDEF